VLSLRYIVDDGALFYLNGTELHRTPNMPQGPIDYSTRPSAVGDANCVSTAVLGLRPVAGTNILAVEIHQANDAGATMDAAFDTELTIYFVRTPAIPQLHFSYDDGQAILTWDFENLVLQTADAVFGSWFDIPTVNRRHVVPVTSTATQKFFRLATP